MGVFLALVVLAGCGVLLLPISLRLSVRWSEVEATPLRLSLRLAGIELLGAPRGRVRQRQTDRGRGPMVPPWLERLTKFVYRRWCKRSRGPKSRDGSRRGIGLFLRRFLSATLLVPTRRLQLSLGGIDPASLGMLHALFLATRPLLPRGDILRFTPRWGGVSTRVELVWHLRFSIASVVGGLLLHRRG